VVIGPRGLTSGQFLARRAFLPSYDAFADDDLGTALERVITPVLIVCSGISLEYYFSTTDGGAGTKVAMNLVGNFGVQQGISGDLLVGLPTQMTEMHAPVRAMYVVNAPVSRLQAVLSRNNVLKDIVQNDWVRMFARDPYTGKFYRQQKGEYLEVTGIPGVNEAAGAGQGGSAASTAPTFQDPSLLTFVPFSNHMAYLDKVMTKEIAYCAGSAFVMLASFLFSISATTDNKKPMGENVFSVTFCGTLVSVLILLFARRYLHGEFMAPRFFALSAAMLVGFNGVASAVTLASALPSWSLLGFTSAFLIGAFNERPTARSNATFAMCVYQVSDCCLMIAAGLHLNVIGPGSSMAAFFLVLACLIKSSQFPFSGLFARAMEGPSPTSALAYAGLSAHAGIVVLTATESIWGPSALARLLMLTVGSATAVYSHLIARIRADRKGSLGHASASTVGTLYALLALGFFSSETILYLCFAHCCIRSVQILRAHNVILETHYLEAAFNGTGGGRDISVNTFSYLAQICGYNEAFLFRLGWKFNQLSQELNLPHCLQYLKKALPQMVRPPAVGPAKALYLSKPQQYIGVVLLLILSGAPYTPVGSWREEKILENVHQGALLGALFWMITQVASVTLLTWLCFANVLDPKRFRHGEDTGSSCPSIPTALLAHNRKVGYQELEGLTGGGMKEL